MSAYARILPAISHYETLARAQHRGAFVAMAGVHFADMQAKYYSAVENPDYSSDTQKFCYLYKYAVAHGYYIYSNLKRLNRRSNRLYFPATRVPWRRGQLPLQLTRHPASRRPQKGDRRRAAARALGRRLALSQ